MKQYIIDAFTHVPGEGNPAAVCILDRWPADESMQALARKNNLSETAFLVREGEFWHLRWFTPETEEMLCGHATLASAYVILNYVEPERTEVLFTGRSGVLRVIRRGDLYEMDFPAYAPREIPVTDAMAEAFGIRPKKALLTLDLTCIFEKEDEIRQMVPDQSLLASLPGRGQNVTAPGRDYDCVSRSFFPKDGIPEDPVCGSAHCQILPYWADVLGRAELTAFQASARGGVLYGKCSENGRILLAGEAVPEKIEEIGFM